MLVTSGNLSSTGKMRSKVTGVIPANFEGAPRINGASINWNVTCGLVSAKEINVVRSWVSFGPFHPLVDYATFYPLKTAMLGSKRFQTQQGCRKMIQKTIVQYSKSNGGP